MRPAILNELRDLLYPDGIKCIVCGREMLSSRYGLCDKCKLELNTNYCIRCGRHKVGLGEYCGECRNDVLYFDEARSSVNYVDSAKALVRRLKYGGSAFLARHICEYMLDTLITADWDAQCFTYVPMDKKREKQRGYNQSKLLAEELANRTTTPCIPLLQKIKATPNQASLNKQERAQNLTGAFGTITTCPAHVILIDDVMTTGATANECAKTLKKNGAKVVYLLTFASVPERPLTDKKVRDISKFGK